jgi:tRNA pseudouridine38-40 synthase
VQSRPFSYLFSISYFGARYKGWAIQPGQATVQGKLEKVLKFVLGHNDFSVLGASRTDAGVSCLGGYVQIFLREKTGMEILLPTINQYLPQDIRLNSVQEVPSNFNLIQSIHQKTYRYFFSNSDEFHPFSSAFLVNIPGQLDWEQMKESSHIFVGKHDFQAFCTPSPNKTDYFREIISAGIYSSNEFLGRYFPQEIFFFEVTGKGFLHHQMRIIMNAIWKVGKGELAMEGLSQRFISAENLEKIAPAPPNGLVLWDTDLNI